MTPNENKVDETQGSGGMARVVVVLFALAALITVVVLAQQAGEQVHEANGDATPAKVTPNTTAKDKGSVTAPSAGDKSATPSSADKTPEAPEAKNAADTDAAASPSDAPDAEPKPEVFLPVRRAMPVNLDAPLDPQKKPLKATSQGTKRSKSDKGAKTKEPKSKAKPVFMPATKSGQFMPVEVDDAPKGETETAPPAPKAAPDKAPDKAKNKAKTPKVPKPVFMPATKSGQFMPIEVDDAPKRETETAPPAPKKTPKTSDNAAPDSGK